MNNININLKFILTISILLFSLLSLGVIYANDDVLHINDLDNETIYYNDSSLESDYQNDILFYDDISSETAFVSSVDKSNININCDYDDYSDYEDDIKSTNGEVYYSFIRYLIDNCNFEFRDSSFAEDGYFIYSTTNYTAKSFDGVNFSILPDNYYFASTNDRLPYFINGKYYDNIVFCHDDNYYLDEEYLSWLIWNQTIDVPQIIGAIDDINVSTAQFNSNLNIRKVAENTNLPSHYDLRDYGFVSPVKNQDDEGNCWSFATMAALESYLLKFENTSYNLSAKWDFSENNLKNVMSSLGRNGTDFDVGCGGNIFMALAYLLRWSGPVNESDDMYGSDYINCTEELNPLKHVQGVELIPLRNNSLDNYNIKKAIYDYGGVVMNMYWDNYPLFNNGINYYFNGNLLENYAINKNFFHAVTVVGWDDSYSKTNFCYHDDIGDGAFIIKNSWGNSVGDSGYYYVSYYDKMFGIYENFSFAGFAFTVVENVTNYESNYNYNPLGVNHWLNIGNTAVRFANQWIADKNEILDSFGLYVRCPSTVLVNVSVNGNAINGFTTANLPYAGFHTIHFNQPISVNESQIFKVEMILSNNNNNNNFDCTDILPLEVLGGNYSKVSSSPNQSFLWAKINGENQWYDLYNLNRANICLQVFTKASTGLIETQVLSNNLVTYYDEDYLVSTLVDCDNNPLANKKIIYCLNQKKYNRTTDENGQAKLRIRLPANTYKILINFIGDDEYHKSNRLVTVKVNFKSTNIVCTMSSCYYKEKLNISLKDSNSKALANKTVIFLLNSKTYKRTTDDNGQASLNINLNNGTYKFIISFAGDKNYLKTNKTVNLKVNKAPAKLNVPDYHVKYNSGKYFTVKVLNSKTNNIISGVLLSLKVYTGNNYKMYNITTNDSGIAKINLSKLSIGSHNVKISSKNNNVVFSTTTKTIKITS